MSVIVRGSIMPVDNKYGRNPDVDGAEDIVDQGGNAIFPTTAAAVTVISGSVEDDTDKGGATPGTGAHTCDVWYLDASDEMQLVEDVELNGAAAVTVAASGKFIYRIKCKTYGSGLTNAGQISGKIGTDITASVPAGFGQTQVAAFRVPANYEYAYLKRWYFYFIGAVNTVYGEFGFLAQEPDEEGFAVKRNAGIIGGTPFVEEFPDNDMPRFPSLTNLKVRCLSVSSANQIVGAGFDLRFKLAEGY